MSGIFSRLGFGRNRKAPSTRGVRFDVSSIRTDEPFIAIGDVHGCYPQLQSLLEKIDATWPSYEIICVGDFVDRGEQSAEALRLLMERQTAAPDRFHCLLGNHEAMMLDFLDRPEKRGERWMRYGGLQTMASFKVGLSANKDYVRARDDLRAAMGPDLEAWIRDLPLQLQRGNVAIVHAALDPELPLNLQERNVQLWGHANFMSMPRSDGTWVVHGHTIVDAASTDGGRIAVDTGAYATGRLTAALIETGDVQFIAS